MFLEKLYSKLFVLQTETPGRRDLFQGQIWMRWPRKGGDSSPGVGEARAVIMTLAKHKHPPSPHHPGREFWKNLLFYISKRALKIQNYVGFLIPILLFSISIWITNRTGGDMSFWGLRALQCLTQPVLHPFSSPDSPGSYFKHLPPAPNTHIHDPLGAGRRGGACRLSVTFSSFKRLPVIFPLTFSCGKYWKLTAAGEEEGA